VINWCGTCQVFGQFAGLISPFLHKSRTNCPHAQGPIPKISWKTKILVQLVQGGILFAHKNGE